MCVVNVSIFYLFNLVILSTSHCFSITNFTLLCIFIYSSIIYNVERSYSTTCVSNKYSYVVTSAFIMIMLTEIVVFSVTVMSIFYTMCGSNNTFFTFFCYRNFKILLSSYLCTLNIYNVFYCTFTLVFTSIVSNMLILNLNIKNVFINIFLIHLILYNVGIFMLLKLIEIDVSTVSMSFSYIESFLLSIEFLHLIQWGVL